jgi:hypothetical protein
MITNVGFTAGAVAAAKDHGIALHVVAPTFGITGLPRGDRAAIQRALLDRASQTGSALYSHHVEHRGMGFAQEAATIIPMPSSAVTPSPAGYETRVVPPPSQPISGPSTNRSISGGETRGGMGPSHGTRGGGMGVKK